MSTRVSTVSARIAVTAWIAVATWVSTTAAAAAALQMDYYKIAKKSIAINLYSFLIQYVLRAMTHLEQLKFVVLWEKRENEIAIKINFANSRARMWNDSVVSQSITLLMCSQSENTVECVFRTNMNDKHT